MPLQSSSDPSYDEQLGTTFTESFTSMLYYVTAVEQTDPTSGVGPAYLLNGLSNTGYWYQVSLAYNWPYTNGGYDAGFHMGYEIFDSNGNSIFPTVCCTGLLTFSGPVNQGDSVALNLYFTNSSQVVMLALDQNTGASASETYSAEGATYFAGSPSSTANSNGFFTGLMTEWYHPAAYYGNERKVTYSSSLALSSAWMWIDEYSPPCCSNTQFFDSTSSPVSYASNPNQLQEFTSNGATEYGDAFEFVTGQLYYALTINYTVSGGGSGYSPPSFTFSLDGATQSVLLTESLATFQVDAYSTWSVTAALSGSSMTERWAVGSQWSSGVAISSETIVFSYQHQYRLFVTGGSGGSNGDGWYDVGSSAVASSQGVFGRSSGSGQRIASYAVDGIVTDVPPTLGPVNVNIVVGSSHQVVFTSVSQYQLSLGPGAEASLVSLSSPTIAGDGTWYDAGSQVNANLAYTWGAIGNQSRFSATSYALDGSKFNLNRQNDGSIIVSLTLDRTHTLNVDSVIQFLLSVNGSNEVHVAPVSPTGDGWYDEGTQVQVSVPHDTDVVNGQRRQDLESYSVDGVLHQVDRNESGAFTTAALPIDRSHALVFSYQTQYGLSISFADNSGRNAILPTSMEVNSTGFFVSSGRFSFWADKGITLQVTKVVWEGLDVSSATQGVTVDVPRQITIRLSVFEAKIHVVDLLGLSVGGAKVQTTLANGTTMTEESESNGTVRLGLIPKGNFKATVSYLGVSTSLNGDASLTQSSVARIPLSLAVVGVIVGGIALIGAAVFFIRRRSNETFRAEGMAANKIRPDFYEM